MAKKKQKKKKFRLPSVYDIRGIDADAMDATIKDIPKYTKEALKEQAKPENRAILAAETFFPYAKAGRGIKSAYKALKNRKRAPAKMKKGGPVKKCRIDGIAKRGFTKAYSMKKGK